MNNNNCVFIKLYVNVVMKKLKMKTKNKQQNYCAKRADASLAIVAMVSDFYLTLLQYKSAKNCAGASAANIYEILFVSRQVQQI